MSSVKAKNLALQTELFFDGIHAYNRVKNSIKKTHREQESFLDKVWKNYPNLRFDIQKYLEDARAGVSTSLSDIAKDIKRIKRSNRLVTYVLWKISTGSTYKLEGATEGEREFINAVALELCQPKIYPEDGVADLKFYDVNSDSIFEDPMFITSVEHIRQRCTENFMDKADSVSAVEAVDNNDKNIEVTEPFTFRKTEGNTFTPGNENESVPSYATTLNNIVTDSGLLPPTESVKRNFEKYIDNILQIENLEYSYGMNHDGSATLFVADKSGIIKAYKVDTGSMFGADNYALMYLLPGYDGNMIVQPVSFKDTDLITRILIPIAVKPTLQEISDSYYKYGFKTDVNHVMFDLSLIDMSKLTEDDKQKFETNLTKIHNIVVRLSEQLGILDPNLGNNFNAPAANVEIATMRRLNTPRFRITSMDSVNSFSFAADPINTKTYLYDCCMHCANTTHGISGSLKGTTLTMYTPDGGSTTYNLNDATWSL